MMIGIYVQNISLDNFIPCFGNYCISPMCVDTFIIPMRFDLCFHLVQCKRIISAICNYIFFSFPNICSYIFTPAKTC
jgi:hypothetical protein